LIGAQTKLATNSTWPITLHDKELFLRPLRFRDKRAWDLSRAKNREWLTPWEATRPEIDSHLALPTFFGMVQSYRRDGQALRSISLGIWLKENGCEVFIGQITLGGIVFGAMRGGHIGYWIDQRYANKGYTSRAVSLLTEFGLEDLALHRIEINLRPENDASKRVAEKCGYIFEGIRPRYLHIAGAWRDHLTYIKENPRIK
jgi:ribosomal-protein-alanine N-acetyltransferase